MARKLKGIRRWKGGWQAYVKVNGHQYHKDFPLETPIADMRKWQQDTRDEHAGDAPVTDAKDSFGAAITNYLEERAGMATIAQVAAHLWAWATALGRDRRPTSVKPGELNKAMAIWERTPTNQPDPERKGRRGRPSAATGLDPATIKKRRGTLRRFFNVMFPDHVNPVKRSLCPKVAKQPDARGIPVEDALTVIAAIPDWKYPKKGIRAPVLAKVRALVFLWTGLPPHLIAQIRPGDLALDAKVPGVRTHRRKKGEGVEARFIELCPQAVAAFRTFIAVNAFGKFAPGPFNVAVKRAARRAGIALPHDFHAYDLRHAFGAALAFSGADEPTIARLMVHAEGSTVGRRYTRLAHQTVNVQAVAALGQHYAAAGQVRLKPDTRTGQKLSWKAVPGRKRRTVRHLRRAS